MLPIHSPIAMVNAKAKAKVIVMMEIKANSAGIAEERTANANFIKDIIFCQSPSSRKEENHAINARTENANVQTANARTASVNNNQRLAVPSKPSLPTYCIIDTLLLSST